MAADSDPIPKPVQAFLTENISSVVELEALLLLHAHAGEWWPASRIAKEMRIDPSWPAAELGNLCNKGILAVQKPTAEPCFSYAPKSPEIDATVRLLAQAYADRRTTIISLIFSKPTEKLRSFADAFRLRKEPPGT